MAVKPIKSDNGYRLSEEIPYRGCPHCGEYQYREVRLERGVREGRNKLHTLLLLYMEMLGFPRYAEWEVMTVKMECRHCEYVESVEEEL